MYHKVYNNFVGPKFSECTKTISKISSNGDEVRKFYLEEVESCKSTYPNNNLNTKKTATRSPSRNSLQDIDLSNHNLFLTVQNNDVAILRQVLNTSPDKINTVDDFGWTLLMIACQANSTDCVIELLCRGIDISVQDKAGNSATSLVIRNKNVTLASILVNNRLQSHHRPPKNKLRIPVSEQFECTVCNKIFPDKKSHLSSTIHNLTASKSKKVPPNYKIPESNKGFQLMLKGGWDKESGLGPDGLGNRYPIKTVLKNDKKGLGLKTKKVECVIKEKSCNKRKVMDNYQKNRRMEIDFRREFY